MTRNKNSYQYWGTTEQHWGQGAQVLTWRPHKHHPLGLVHKGLPLSTWGRPRSGHGDLCPAEPNSTGEVKDGTTEARETHPASAGLCLPPPLGAPCGRHSSGCPLKGARLLHVPKGGSNHKSKPRTLWDRMTTSELRGQAGGETHKGSLAGNLQNILLQNTVQRS